MRRGELTPISIVMPYQKNRPRPGALGIGRSPVTAVLGGNRQEVGLYAGLVVLPGLLLANDFGFWEQKLCFRQIRFTHFTCQPSQYRALSKKPKESRSARSVVRDAAHPSVVVRCTEFSSLFDPTKGIGAPRKDERARYDRSEQRPQPEPEPPFLGYVHPLNVARRGERIFPDFF